MIACSVEVEHAVHEKCLIMKLYALSVMHNILVLSNANNIS